MNITILCGFIACFLFFIPISATDTSDSKSLSEHLNTKQSSNTNSVSKSSYLYLNEGVIIINHAEFSNYLTLSARQEKKINKKYKSYLKKQLKIKPKITLLSMDIDTIELGYDNNYELESVVDKIFKNKSNMFFNNIVLLKEIESILKKEQTALFLELVDPFYYVKI